METKPTEISDAEQRRILMKQGAKIGFQSQLLPAHKKYSGTL